MFNAPPAFLNRIDTIDNAGGHSPVRKTHGQLRADAKAHSKHRGRQQQPTKAEHSTNRQAQSDAEDARAAAG